MITLSVAFGCQFFLYYICMSDLPENFPVFLEERMIADKLISEARYRVICQVLELLLKETGGTIPKESLLTALDNQALEIARRLLMKYEGENPEMATRIWNAVKHDLTHETL